MNYTLSVYDLDLWGVTNNPEAAWILDEYCPIYAQYNYNFNTDDVTCENARFSFPCAFVDDPESEFFDHIDAYDLASLIDLTDPMYWPSYSAAWSSGYSSWPTWSGSWSSGWPTWSASWSGIWSSTWSSTWSSVWPSYSSGWSSGYSSGWSSGYSSATSSGWGWSSAYSSAFVINRRLMSHGSSAYSSGFYFGDETCWYCYQGPSVCAVFEEGGYSSGYSSGWTWDYSGYSSGYSSSYSAGNNPSTGGGSNTNGGGGGESSSSPNGNDPDPELPTAKASNTQPLFFAIIAIIGTLVLMF
jgi:hypothetical protein